MSSEKLSYKERLEQDLKALNSNNIYDQIAAYRVPFRIHQKNLEEEAAKIAAQTAHCPRK